MPTKPITRQTIRQLLKSTTQNPPDFAVTRAPREKGDWTSNFALVLAAQSGQTPQPIAENLANSIQNWPGRIEARNGRLNFMMSDEYLQENLGRAAREGAHYGAGESLAGKRILVEWVSSDPTGPLPFAHGRSAALGEAICRLLEWQGARVTREFYLNDAATASKIRLLGESVAAWYLEAFGRHARHPEGALENSFVKGVAAEIARRDGGKWLETSDEERVAACADFAREAAIAAQKATLERFGVRFDQWVSEAALRREGRVETMIARLREDGHLAEHDGALWLQTARFGDESDRPLVRANGEPTYLAGDIAYHLWKEERGFDTIINIWSTPHQPYIARTKAALQAAGCQVEKFEFLVYQGAVLKRDGRALRLGTGGGPLILEEELKNLDAATLKWGFLSREMGKEAEIELEIAARDDESNPAYAIQLLPSRLARLARETEANLQENATKNWGESQREIARLTALWPDEAQTAAQERDPARIARFVAELSEATRELLKQNRPAPASNDDLSLLRAAQTAANAALQILGIEASERF